MITLATINGPIDIEVKVTGEWAVHRALFDTRPNVAASESWTVTHVPTGLRIPRDLTSKRARDLMDRLAREVPTLGVSPGIRTVPAAIEDLGPQFAELLGKLNKIVHEVCP
jgi:hypothetical protein